MNYQTLLYLTCLSIGMICNYHFMFFLSTRGINHWWMKLVRHRGSLAAFGISGKDGGPASKKWCQERSCASWILLLLWQGFWAPTTTVKDTRQGPGPGVSSCHSYRQPSLRICQKVSACHKMNGNLSCIQGLLFLICLKTERSFHVTWILTTVCLLSMYSSTMTYVGWNFRHLCGFWSRDVT